MKQAVQYLTLNENSRVGNWGLRKNHPEGDINLGKVEKIRKGGVGVQLSVRMCEFLGLIATKKKSAKDISENGRWFQMK